MCFSATASFSAGGALTLLGAVTIRHALAGSNPRDALPFAAIPLLFGAQQLAEGMLWLALEHDLEHLKTIATYIFTFFSHMLWPVFIPYAVARLESGQGSDPEPWRWQWLWAFRVTGIVVALMLMGLVTTEPLTAVEDVHIVYVTPFFYDWPMMVLYIAATCFSCLLSRQAMVRLFGLLVLLFFFIAYWFYTEAFFSVWCFFAAILSVVIFRHFRRMAPVANRAG